MTPLTITSADGTALAAYDHGNAHGDAVAPTLVCVHGWPDDHTLWDDVVPLLTDRFRVVTFDNRGAGESEAPGTRSAYALDRLGEDLAAVADTVSPDRPVHVLGHDWGSIYGWHHVTSEAGRGRVASFTSISGPSLDRAGSWIRTGSRDALSQLAHSWYVMAFQVPVLPELAIRTGMVDRLIGVLVGDGPRPSGGRRDMQRGLGLYRANFVPRLLRPRSMTTDVPVQVLTPQDDPVVTPAVQVGTASAAAQDLRVRAIPGSHWVPRSHPKVVAQLTASFVDDVEAR